MNTASISPSSRYSSVQSRTMRLSSCRPYAFRSTAMSISPSDSCSGLVHRFRHQDRPRARAEHRLGLAESPQRLDQILRCSSFSMVVLSPPGITSPSTLSSSSGVRTSTGSAPARRAPSRVLRNRPAGREHRRASPPLPAASLHQLALRPSAGYPALASPFRSSSLASSSFTGSL